MIEYEPNSSKKGDHVFNLSPNTRASYAGINWQEFTPQYPSWIFHPCGGTNHQHVAFCRSVQTCWEGSKLKSDGDPYWDIMCGNTPYDRKEVLPSHGYWIGGSHATEDVATARTLIYIPAYSAAFYRVLLNHSADVWYETLVEIRDSISTFIITDKYSDDLNEPGNFSYASLLVKLINSLVV